MLRTSIPLNNSMKCPICDRSLDAGFLEQKNLSFEIVRALALHVQAGALEDVLKIAEIGMRNLRHDNLSIEMQHREQVESTQRSLLQMIESVQQSQANFLQQLVNVDESNRRKLLLDHTKLQQDMTDRYKSDILSKIEVIRKSEEDRSKEYAELNKTLRELHEKLFGTNIGVAGEAITILDLKRVCPTDVYSEVRSAKHGTDIVAEVIEYGKKCGRISISVKYHQKWDSDFLTQLTKNMYEDNSKWGILVSKAFPKEALNNYMWTTRDNVGNMILMVKPEYAPLAYYAARQIAIHWTSIESLLKSRDSLKQEEERIMRAVVDWLSGEKFEKILQYISNAVKVNKEISNGLISMQNYFLERVKKLREYGDGLHGLLECIAGGLADLKQLLHKPVANDSSHTSEGVIRQFSKEGSKNA